MQLTYSSLYNIKKSIILLLGKLCVQIFHMPALICWNAQYVTFVTEILSYAAAHGLIKPYSKLQHFNCKQLVSIKYTTEQTNA